MSYLVLARKYRPTSFAEVVGQDHVTRTLRNAFATDRVHHALLFTGPRGCGKTTLARIVGKALNCERAPAHGTADPCGECNACLTIANGSAVDYMEMDGASNRGIDAIRELTEAVRYQPAMLRKKVYVIDEVHMLTTEAFNALLKTLEEPPPHVTFVLATTEPHKLPNTILSRCQRYDFKLVPATKLAQHLTQIFGAEKLSVEPAAVGLIVRESGGSVRDALSIGDQVISFVGNATISEALVAEVLGVADRTLTRGLVRALADGDAGAALSLVESAVERGVDEVQLARAIVRYLRDLAVIQATDGGAQLLALDMSDEERADRKAEGQQIGRARVAQMFDRMLRCCDELGKTVQPRLVLDCALIDLATIEPLVPLGDLIERLGELEAKLARGGASATRAAPSSGEGGGARPSARPTVADSPSAKKPSASASASPPSPSPSPTGSPTPKNVGVSPSPTGSLTPKNVGVSPSPTGSLTPKNVGVSPSPTGSLTPKNVGVSPSGPVPTIAKTAAGSGPHDEPMNAWKTVLTELETRRKFSLFGYYQPARVMKWGKGELELGYPIAVAHTGEMASEKTSIDELAAVMKELGFDVKITVRLLDASESTGTSARSVLEASHETKHQERTKREAEAREHPMTKHVLQTFGAQIKEIKTDV